MLTSSITDRFMLGDEGAGQLIQIIENNKIYSAKKIINLINNN